jgi:hypothetical protein
MKFEVYVSKSALRAGLSSAAWITVDDTGGRHKAANGFCTQIGNAQFACLGTSYSKSRSNFLDLCDPPIRSRYRGTGEAAPAARVHSCGVQAPRKE